MVVAAVGAGVLNYLANVSVARMLGVEEYGTVSSLLALPAVLTALAGVLQTVVATHVARLRTKHMIAEIGTLLAYVLPRAVIGGLCGAAMLSFSATWIAKRLGIASPLPIAALGLVFIPMGGLPVVTGTLQGMGRFGALGAVQVYSGACRLVASIAFILVGLGAAGAVVALPFSYLASLLLGLVLSKDLARQRTSARVHVKSLLSRYSANATLAVTSFAALTSMDLVVAKARFSPAEAGLYCGMATVGKTALWLSSPIVTMLLPKVIEQHTRGGATLGILRRGVAVILALSGGLTVVFVLSPQAIVRSLVGGRYVGLAPLLGAYGMAMTAFSVTNAWLYYYHAIQDERYAYMLLAGAVVALAAAVSLGTNPLNLVAVLFATGLLLSVAGQILLITGAQRLR